MFRLSVSYKGYDQDLDSKMAKVIGRRDVGAGYCFIDDTRDVDFSFRDLSKLIEARAKVKSVFRRKVKTEIYDKNDDRIHPNSKILKGK